MPSTRAVLALAVLFAEAWVIARVLASGAPARTRAAWIAIVLLIPVLGLVLCLRSGPRPHRRARSVT